MTGILIYLVRCGLVILTTWLVTNFIGKKSLARLTPYDLAILFILSNVAAEPLVNKDAFKTTIGVMILGLSMVGIARLSLTRPFKALDGTPSIVIAKGRIDREALKKNRLSIPMLLSMLRVKGYRGLAEVHYAILEAGGELSVLPKSGVQPVTLKDLKLQAPQETTSFPVIVDGELDREVLPHLNISEAWLLEKLKRHFHMDLEEVLYAEMDRDKGIVVQGVNSVIKQKSLTDGGS